MPAYLIAGVDVTDPDAYTAYASRTIDIARKYNGRFLVKGGAMEVLEGSPAPRCAVIEFPDRDSARAMYMSPEYQAVLPIRLANSTGDLFIVDGL